MPLVLSGASPRFMEVLRNCCQLVTYRDHLCGSTGLTVNIIQKGRPAHQARLSVPLCSLVQVPSGSESAPGRGAVPFFLLTSSQRIHTIFV